MVIVATGMTLEFAYRCGVIVAAAAMMGLPRGGLRLSEVWAGHEGQGVFGLSKHDLIGSTRPPFVCLLYGQQCVQS